MVGAECGLLYQVPRGSVISGLWKIRYYNSFTRRRISCAPPSPRSVQWDRWVETQAGEKQIIRKQRWGKFVSCKHDEH